MLHVAERHAGLLPAEPHARAIMWMFASLDTVEPPLFDALMLTIVERN